MALPVTIRRPSPLNVALVTSSECSSVSTSPRQAHTGEVGLPTARRVPEGLKATLGASMRSVAEAGRLAMTCPVSTLQTRALSRLRRHEPSARAEGGAQDGQRRARAQYGSRPAAPSPVPDPDRSVCSPVNTSRSSGLNAALKMGAPGCRSSARSRGSPLHSHTRASLALAVRMKLPLRLNTAATRGIVDASSRYSSTGFPASQSQTRAAPSTQAVSTKAPSGLNEADVPDSGGAASPASPSGSPPARGRSPAHSRS